MAEVARQGMDRLDVRFFWANDGHSRKETGGSFTAVAEGRIQTEEIEAMAGQNGKIRGLGKGIQRRLNRHQTSNLNHQQISSFPQNTTPVFPTLIRSFTRAASQLARRMQPWLAARPIVSGLLVP